MTAHTSAFVGIAANGEMLYVGDAVSFVFDNPFWNGDHGKTFTGRLYYDSDGMRFMIKLDGNTSHGPWWVDKEFLSRCSKI